MHTQPRWPGSEWKSRCLIAVVVTLPLLLVTLFLFTRPTGGPISLTDGAPASKKRDGDSAMASVLSGDVKSLSKSDLASSLDQLEEAFRNDPKSFEGIVIQAASDLAATDPAEAFLFLSRFHGSKALAKAKRQIVLAWSGEATADGMLAAVEDRAGTRLLAPFLVSIGQKEQPHVFDELLVKMSSPGSPDDRDSRVSIAEAMVELCHPGNRITVGSRFTAVDELHPYATALLVKQAKDSPDETVQLLTSGQFAPLGEEAVSDVLRAVGEADPEFACGLIEQSGLGKLIQGHESVGGQDDGAMDRAINSLLLGVLASDPGRVIDQSAALADQSIGEDLRQRAVELSNSRRN